MLIIQALSSDPKNTDAFQVPPPFAQRDMITDFFFFFDMKEE